MPVTIAFDVYGTLIDTQGVLSELEKIMGEKAPSFSQTWREKQLEYSFRRGLMKRYENFAVCTAQALDYTSAYYKISLTDGQKQSLLESYKTLPAFDDVTSSLTQLKSADCSLYAFSNGSALAVETLLEAAGIRNLFDGIVSTDDIQSFKPNPDVYHHLLQKTGSTANETWLISSNPFDVIGAINTNLNAAWVQRSKDTIFDPWGVEPTTTIETLDALSVHVV